MKLINTAVDEFIINELLALFTAEQRLAGVLAVACHGTRELPSDDLRAEVSRLNARLDDLEHVLNALDTPTVETAAAA